MSGRYHRGGRAPVRQGGNPDVARTAGLRVERLMLGGIVSFARMIVRVTTGSAQD